MESGSSASPELAKLDVAVDVARKFGTLKIKVTGDSMLPSVWPGDVITVEHQPLDRFRPGDIVLAARRQTAASSRGAEFVAHRVVRRQGHQLVTRGDSLPHNDPPIEEGEILGRVISVTRNGRAIDPAFTLGRRLASWMLRRSEFSVRVLRKFRRTISSF